MAKELISKVIEDYTKEQIFADLSKGDPKWDIPHTTAVVHHLKEIIKSTPRLNVDTTVLIIAAYGHDWGYSNFYKHGQSLTKEEYLEAKKTHAQLAQEKMKKLLSNNIYDILNSSQKDRILHLILVHDNFDSLTETDELILMEADTLGGLDTDFVTSTWTKEQDIRHVSAVREKRLSHFITPYGKNTFEICAEKRLSKALAR